MHRRDFVKIGSVLAATTTSQLNVYGSEAPPALNQETSKTVDFIHDGAPLSPKEYAELLMRLADEGKIKPDNYSNGGVVEELEVKFAKLMGKESAMFVPTGTLANHLGIRKLAQNNRRVIIQEQSHFYLDSGDCAQTLSGLNMIPVGHNATEFSLQEVVDIVEKTQKGRVETHVGVIAIETPVRRQNDRMFKLENIKAISDYAKKNNIKMHVDGARLFVQCAHTNVNPTKYGELFDTVFISTWKCFGAAAGAVLCGTKEFTTGLYHERRMFGSGLPASWPFAAVTLHFADDFLEGYKTAWKKAEVFFTEIQKNDRMKITQFDGGCHIVRLDVKNANLTKFVAALDKRNVKVAAPIDANRILLRVNPTLNRTTAQNLAGLFNEALKEATA
jgi:threonine aldolase